VVNQAPLPVGLSFQELARRRASSTGQDWFEGAVAATDPRFDRAAFLHAFTAAARRLGKGVVTLHSEEVAGLGELGVTCPPTGWGLDELGRVALLLRAAASLPAGELGALVDECYAQGDSRERQAVLRAVPLLPDPERYLALAVEACRSSIQPLFEAIACENTYPAEHFPGLNFNQLVLKALFTGVAVERIVGLEGRVTPELRRMAADYANERRAAGRSVPSDIGRLLGEKGSTL
jgi:hypothetical protein